MLHGVLFVFVCFVKMYLLDFLFFVHLLLCSWAIASWSKNLFVRPLEGFKVRRSLRRLRARAR